MIDTNKKKKRGLGSMDEKMGLDEGTDFFSPKGHGILPGSAEAELNDRDQERSVGSRVRDRMTGRRGAEG